MISRDGGRLRVTGRLTLDSVAGLLDLGPQAAGETSLVIDLAQVEALDSAAVSLMLAWMRQAQRSGVNLCFAHVPENLSSLARLYGVTEMLPLCP